MTSPQDSSSSSRIVYRCASMLAWYSIEYLLLACLYVYFVFSTSAYMGFDVAINLEKVPFSMILIIAFVAITPQKNNLRSFFLNCLLAIYIIPSSIVYAFSDKETWQYLVILYSCLIVYIASAVQIPVVRTVYIHRKILLQVSLASTVAILFAIWHFSGFANFNLDITQVYEFRSEASNDLPGIFGYITSITAKIIIPLGLVISLQYRKYLTAAAVIAMAVILFGFTSNKGVLVYPILSVAIYVFLLTTMRFSLVIAGLSAALIFACIDAALYFSFDGASPWGLFVDIIVRRGIFLPPLLDYDHLTFFGENPKFYWSMSKITLGMVPSPYDITPQYVIGQAFFHSADTAANTGFIGNGYAQAGLLGSTVYAIGVGFVISLLSNLGRKFGAPFVGAIVFSQVITMLTGADFLTMMLTHGMLVSLFLLMVVRSPEDMTTSRNKERSLPLGLASELP
ncbi:hypothetical protein [Manganibacter manganicus]|uniref:Uncharacterized protein n=1 Tax=Manganibacter manganicus TaxID=1873176 RepID=A0A1V8RLV3_9HYPH|nr:hypothetical protein [Pseudaminobacter manganicus]OQM74126.1 hypothetical protein BFN67_22585 [Pseudaminobacter manganicus]